MLTRGDKPTVSVIMGAYNILSVPWRDEAFRSVLTQSFRDFELIICDDGSTDATWEYLTELATTDPRILLIRNQENQGLAASLNRCLEKAGGEFIARQDADDISDPERLAKQVQFLQANAGFGFVGSCVSLWDERGTWGIRQLPEFPKAKDFLFTMPFLHGALMFRKSTLDAVNGYRVAKETRRTEDYDLLMRVYTKGIYGANLQEILYKFREDVSSKRRRKYRYRIDEAKVRLMGFTSLGLMPRGIIYVLKPLIVGLIPNRLLDVIQNHRYKVTRGNKK